MRLLFMNGAPARFTRLLQIDGETEADDLRTLDFIDRWEDSAWENMISWQGTLADIGPSEKTLARFEDDGGQPAPEIEKQVFYRRSSYPRYIVREVPVAVRR